MHYEANKIDSTAQAPTAEERLLVDLLNRVSLNNIRVLVGGIMTVDSATIPPVLESITFADPAPTRVIAGTYKATIRGTFLGGGTPRFMDTTTGKASAFLTAATPDKTSSETQLASATPSPPGASPATRAHRHRHQDGGG